MFATYGIPHIWKRRAIHMQYGIVGWIAMGYEAESGMDENGLKWEEWLEKV